ncbi:MAG: capsule assembly Wzi family protein [Nitrospirae bacterium]|nr:capsule assembly Wzi family protein [Nitrospirota bacterium]
MSYFRQGLIVISLLGFITDAYGTNVSQDEDTYDLLLILEAEGIIKSGLLTTKPMTKKEVARLIKEAEKSEAKKSPFISAVISSLKKKFKAEVGSRKYLKPIDTAYGRLIYSDRDAQELSYNNDGDSYRNGTNVRLGLSGMAEYGRLSVFANPEIRYSSEKAGIKLRRGYVTFGFLGLELEIGKDSEWWGPGYHGALLLSTNAEPVKMLKLTNPKPARLPFIHGPFRFTVFVSRLEKERDFPEPYLWGLRFNFKPIQYLELGLQRTAILGGEGRSESPKTWLNSFIGRGENNAGREAGDQKAGGDVKLILPFRWQPMQIYLEAAGEDEANGLPSKWAYLGGIYLPRILSIENIDFRAEYATTHVKGSPNVWYSHHVYTSGYTYEGRTIGHHMGGDSEDIFFELNYRMPETMSRFYVSYDRERHNLSDSLDASKHEASLGVRLIEGNMDIEAGLRTAWLKSTNGNKENISMVVLGMNYHF